MLDIIHAVWIYIVSNTTFLITIIVILLTGVYLYVISREKKELLKVLDNKVKIFQKAFDISEDAILILSKNNDVLYANKTMINLLSLPKNFMFKKLPIIPMIKIKSDWVLLDKLIDIGYTKENSKMISYLQTSMSHG